MSEVEYELLSKIIQPPISGKRPSGGVDTETEGVPSLGGENILSNGGVKYNVIKRIPFEYYNLMPKGKLLNFDVLINKDGAQTGKVGIYKKVFEEAAINEHLFILRPLDSSKANPIYIYYCLLLPETRQKIERRITGSAQPGLNSNFVNAVSIPIYSIVIQQKIATILSSIDTAIEKTEALIQKYQQTKAGLMHDLFTRGVTADGKLRPSREQAPELYQETAIGWIPKSWEVDKIGNLFFIQLGKMLSKVSKTGKYSAFYLGNKNIQWDNVDLSNLEEMDFSPQEREKFSLYPNDLLVCEGGDVGRTAIWKGEKMDCFYQKAIHRLRPKDKRIKPSYALRYMKYAKDNGVLTSFISISSIAHLTQEKLACVCMFRPELEEQKEIIVSFDSVDFLIFKEKEALEKLNKQKQGLMQDLLTGKVRVKVDPPETANV